MEIFADEFCVIESYCQGKCLRKSLVFFIDHMCGLQESNVILRREEVHTSSVIDQRHECRDVPRNYLRDHVRSHATVSVRIYQIDDSIYDF